jgi:hypothetical protein
MGVSIQNLPVREFTAADQIPFFSTPNGQDSRGSLTDLATLMQSLLTSAGSITQYAAPSATGFSVTIAPPTAGGSVYLLLTPTAGFAAGTIVLPTPPADRQEVSVVTTQAISTLTVSGNGATVTGSPSTLAANATFKLRYNAAGAAGWYPAP